MLSAIEIAEEILKDRSKKFKMVLQDAGDIVELYKTDQGLKLIRYSGVTNTAIIYDLTQTDKVVVKITKHFTK